MGLSDITLRAMNESDAAALFEAGTLSLWLFFSVAGVEGVTVAVGHRVPAGHTEHTAVVHVRSRAMASTAFMPVPKRAMASRCRSSSLYGRYRT